KVPVVNYEIVMINNKPRYKIIRADDSHQLYTSFITLLKNFDREDLEDLWKIVKARFSTSKPTNFSDDYLLVTLKTMFEKTDAQDVIWRSQQTEYGQALVKSWKLLTSCGLNIITFITTMFALLVEKKYPLSRFTLEQLVNVARLQLLELMLLKRSKENTKCVSAAGEELTAAKNKLELKLFRDAAAAAHIKSLNLDSGYFELQCKIILIKLLADPAFSSDFHSCVDIFRFLADFCKAYRVFNSRTRIVQETLHVNFMENKPNAVGSGPTWLFDIDSLTRTMNYHPVIAENQTNSHAGLQDTEKAGEEVTHTYVLFPMLSDGSTNSQNKNKNALVDGKEHDDDIQNSNGVNAASSSVSTVGHNFINSTNDFSADSPSNTAASPTVANSSSQDASTSSHDSNMPNLEDLTHSDDVGTEADINNLESIILVSP
nr:hypothetical protein [Tanacetum cinerariifolium]